MFNNNLTLKSVKLHLPYEFKLAILGIVPAGFEGRKKIYLLQILLAAAKKMITINWLDPHPPSHAQWLSKVKEIRDMERLTYLVRLQNDQFTRRWTPFMCLEV